jgi:hypothetical protein
MQMGFSLDFIPSDADLLPWVLGVSVLRADGDLPVRFPVPAHALAMGSLALRGELYSVGPGGRRIDMPPWYIVGSATRAQAYEG